jgi:type I restriction enzyme S subunit
METNAKIKIGDVVQINPPLTKDLTDVSMVSFLGMTDVSESGKVLRQQERNINEVRSGFTAFQNEDVLVAKITPCFENGKGALVSDLINGVGFGSTEFHVLRATSNVLPQYLHYQTNHSTFRKLGEACMVGSAGQKRVQANFIETYKIFLPPLAEQKKISVILSTWDNAIETCKKLIAAKFSRKRALMQKLLSGKKRFPEFQGQKLKYAFLGDVASESTERNKSAMTNEKLMAVMKTAGMVPMREHVQGKSGDRCKTVAPNWFAYNPMRLNIGSIAQWKGTEKVMVSGDYVVFKCDESKLDPDYLNHFRKSEIWTNFVKSNGDGSVRIRIYFSHLAEMKMLLPSLEEQKRIAAVLNACDTEINLLTEKLEALKNQKRGLMQQLLTGRVRVHVEEESNSDAVAV